MSELQKYDFYVEIGEISMLFSHISLLPLPSIEFLFLKVSTYLHTFMFISLTCSLFLKSQKQNKDTLCIKYLN